MLRLLPFLGPPKSALIYSGALSWGRFLTAEWDRPQVVSHWSERGDRQEQQRTDDYDRAEQKTSEGKGVVAQSAQSEWRTLLHTKKAGHRNRGDNRQKSPKHDHKASGDIPWDRFRRRTRVIVESIGGSQAVESGAV